MSQEETSVPSSFVHLLAADTKMGTTSSFSGQYNVPIPGLSVYVRNTSGAIIRETYLGAENNVPYVTELVPSTTGSNGQIIPVYLRVTSTVNVPKFPIATGTISMKITFNMRKNNPSDATYTVFFKNIELREANGTPIRNFYGNVIVPAITSYGVPRIDFNCVSPIPSFIRGALSARYNVEGSVIITYPGSVYYLERLADGRYEVRMNGNRTVTLGSSAYNITGYFFVIGQLTIDGNGIMRVSMPSGTSMATSPDFRVTRNGSPISFNKTTTAPEVITFEIAVTTVS